MRQGKNKKILIIAVVLVLISWTTVAIMLSLIEKNKRLFVETFGFVSAHQAKKESVVALAKDLEELKEDIALLEKLIIGRGQEDVAIFIGKIETLATENNVGVSVERIGIVEYDEKESSFENIEVRLKISGSWGRVLNFAGLIENLPYQIEISELSFNSVTISQEQAGTEWQANILFKVLKFK